MSRHTPTPYRVDGSGFRIRTAGPDGKSRRGGNVLIATVAEQFMDGKAREDTAAFLVRACNAHEELLAACKAAKGLRAAAGRDFGPAIEECNRIEAQIDAAISKAEAQP